MSLLDDEIDRIRSAEKKSKPIWDHVGRFKRRRQQEYGAEQRDFARTSVGFSTARGPKAADLDEIFGRK